MVKCILRLLIWRFYIKRSFTSYLFRPLSMHVMQTSVIAAQQTLMKCIWGLQLRNRTICRLVLLFKVMSTVKWFRIANLHGKRAMICVRTLLSSVCEGFGRSEFLLLRSPPNPISSNNVSTFGPFVLSQLIIAWYLVKQKEKKTTSYCIMLH